MIDPARVREVAEDVISRPTYRELEPSPLSRALSELRSRIAEWLFDVLGGGAAANVGVVVAVVVVLIVVVLGVVALLGVRRRAAADLVVDEAPGTTPGDAVVAADAARAAGDLATAVRRRYGALLLELVDRDVLPALPGITVGEVNGAVAGVAPAAAGSVIAAGQALADIVYGHRPATAADDDTVAAAVARVREQVPRRAVAA